MAAQPWSGVSHGASAHVQRHPLQWRLGPDLRPRDHAVHQLAAGATGAASGALYEDDGDSVDYLMPTAAELNEQVRKDMDRLSMLQSYNGGFGFW